MVCIASYVPQTTNRIWHAAASKGCFSSTIFFDFSDKKNESASDDNARIVNNKKTSATTTKRRRKSNGGSGGNNNKTTNSTNDSLSSCIEVDYLNKTRNDRAINHHRARSVAVAGMDQRALTDETLQRIDNASARIPFAEWFDKQSLLQNLQKKKQQQLPQPPNRAPPPPPRPIDITKGGLYDHTYWHTEENNKNDNDTDFDFFDLYSVYLSTPI